MPTFKTYAFGCRVNQAEEEEVRKKMFASGFKWDEENPDIYIVNTCAVTDKAEREARQLIYDIKRDTPKTYLVVTGCALTNWQKQSLLGKMPIDFPVDNINKDYLVDLIKTKISTKAQMPFLRQPPASHLPMEAAEKKGIKLLENNKYISSGRYFIKIQDGCHRFCSFCIVPYLRGLPRSTPSETIVERINHLPPSIKEVVLTAINTEAYGKDNGEDFIGLVKSVLEKTHIERVSFGSIHPWSIDKTFFDFYKKGSNRIVNFFHIPLQSGSDKQLALMKRGYKRAEMEEKLFAIQKIDPYAMIGTDVIVGFLEETDTDFQDTYTFLQKVPVHKFHVFRFSRKKRTAAYYLSKRLVEPSPQKKHERSRLLIRLGQKKLLAFQDSLVGKTFSCLFLQNREENMTEGLLSNQMSVYVPIDKNLGGHITTVKVTGQKKGRLVGKLLS